MQNKNPQNRIPRNRTIFYTFQFTTSNSGFDVLYTCTQMSCHFINESKISVRAQSNEKLQHFWICAVLSKCAITSIAKFVCITCCVDGITLVCVCRPFFALTFSIGQMVDTAHTRTQHTLAAMCGRCRCSMQICVCGSVYKSYKYK